nr:hypothetical protein L204_05008 [Cryptococcus depauperatus CBS 7855]
MSPSIYPLVDTILRYYPLSTSWCPETKRPFHTMPMPNSYIIYSPALQSPSRFTLPEIYPQSQTQQICSPVPVLHNYNSLPALASPGFDSSLPPSRRGSADHLKLSRSQSLSRASMSGKENSFGDTLAPSPINVRQRTSSSPRLPKLSALSPLQAFSPLESTRRISETAAPLSSSLQRAGSLTRGLSRRESMIENAKKWTGEDNEEDEGTGLFSRLTLVKAPTQENNKDRRHIRSKSQSSLVPFNAFASSFTAPATSARGPRRSFAASSFGASPNTQTMPLPSPCGQAQNDSLHRVHSRLEEGDNIQSRYLSPDEVFTLAQSISSPVTAASDEGLKRRKSASSLPRRSALPDSPEKVTAELEPVEYVQMEEDVLLPFIDRAADVHDLLHSSVNAKLFSLLHAAFPKGPARPNWKQLNPEQWRWEEFVKHLTETDRADMDDYDWTFKARQAVRVRNVSLWEKLGVCLGCDEDLLNAGSEDDSPPSWGGLGLGEEGEYDPSANRVLIAGLEPKDEEEAEARLKEEFGEIVEDEEGQAQAGMGALLELGSMATIGENEEEGHKVQTSQTPAQRAGNKANIDPLLSQTCDSSPQHADLHSSPRPFTSPNSPTHAQTAIPEFRSPRKSFVGLQIRTAPSRPLYLPLMRSPSVVQTPTTQNPLPIYDRGPGSPLFPSSFSQISREPNLGRRASVAVGEMVNWKGDAQIKDELHRWRKEMRGGSGYPAGVGELRSLRRKPSGAGLSESAITFASESDWSGH